MIALIVNDKVFEVDAAPDTPLRRHPVKVAWVAEEVPQCGYCQPGQIMQAAAFLAKFPEPADGDIDQEMTGICRCGTDPRIRFSLYDQQSLKVSPVAEQRP